MEQDKLKRILDDNPISCDESEGDTLCSMMGEFFNRKMLHN